MWRVRFVDVIKEIHRLQMANNSIGKPVHIVEDVLVKVGKFVLPADFVVQNFTVDINIPISLARAIKATWP
ncbi:hypothetical protein HAX54_034289 [Datura stramonium]|uniref:Uncharacterized protein n=1 Tax=Datura stramonium TaxID=4076 RepID=A0ABS8SE48_DATST|nr:hypothetical protein [Datura stramonium]